MILESLLELVETLKERIDAHGDQLRQSEALTRYALIDPLLRELGWDTEDPDVVRPEYRVPNNQLADYVLFAVGKPTIVVESKKLDEPLQGGKALDQGILYCAHTGSNYFLLTDGRRYELYESGKTTAVISFDLKGASSADVCLRALALWRPSVQSGHAVPGLKSVIGSTEEHSDHEHTPAPPPPPPPPGDWVPLTKIKVSKDMKPIELQFPDEACVPVQYWYSLMTESTSWLLYDGHLAHGFLPIQFAGKYLVSTTPTHPNGAQMTSGKEVGGLWVETNYNSSSCIKNAITIIETVGQNPEHFSVRFA